MRHARTAARVVVVASVAALTGGCHLIYPFDLGEEGAPSAEVGPPDAVAADSGDPKPDQGPGPDLDQGPGPGKDALPPAMDLKHQVVDSLLPKPSWNPMTVTGDSWLAGPPPSIWGVDSNTIYVSANKSLYECAEASSKNLTCTLIKTTTAQINDLGGEGSEVYAVGDNSMVLSRSNGWKSITKGTEGIDFISIWCHGTKSCAVTGTNTTTKGHGIGQIDNGVYAAVTGSGELLEGIWSDSIKGLWVAVGASGFIALKSAFSSSWDKSKHGPQGLKAVWGSAGTVHAVGTSGVRLIYSGTWSTASPTGATLNALWGASSSAVYAVGASGGVYKYNGKAWSGKLTGPFGSSNLTDVWGVSKYRIYVVGPGAKVFRYGI